MFGLAFSFCLTLCFSGFWLGSLALMIVGLRRRSTPLTGASGLVFAVFSIIAVAYAVVALDSGRPPMVFKHFFGFEPTPDVSDLHTEYSSVDEFSYAFLRFKALPATVDRIVAARGLPRAPDSFFPNSDLRPPNWWAAPAGGETLRYGGEFDRELSWSAEVLIYDRSTNTAYYHYIGIE